jgi:hypothetical protein
MSQSERKHFFISYNRADRHWAEWVAWMLEAAGYSVIIQAWDFRPGGNFVLDMDRAAKEAEKTIAILSNAYLQAAYTQPEWAAAFVDDPQGLQRKLIPIRVEDCTPEGLLKPIVYVDLVGRSEAEAQQDILNALKERAKPDQKPIFPGQAQSVRSHPVAFPTEPGVWAVPHDRNPFFTGREASLQDIQAQLATHQIAAVCGMRGVGKTQTAIEFAHRYRYDYEFVFWVRAETREELISGFVAIASDLQLPIRNEPDHNMIVAAVKQWFKTQQNWLLILDNADDLQLVKEFLPNRDRGQILLTSTAQATGAIPKIEINEMSLTEGGLLLLRRAHPTANYTALTDADQRDRLLAETICQEMDGLPLALDQAGAYMEETPSSLDDYLTLYREEKIQLLAARGELVVDDHPSVTVTFSLAFRQVEEGSLQARGVTSWTVLQSSLCFLCNKELTIRVMRRGRTDTRAWNLNAIS